MAQKIIRTGNSSAVTLPVQLMKVLNLKVGDPVEVRVDYLHGEITFRFPSARQLPLAHGEARLGRLSTKDAQKKSPASLFLQK